jgi:alpha-amylase/alpha-mannosidase (GH57 family)
MSKAEPKPVYLAFGLHAHQPVGNFDHVFQEHLDDVYRPFLTRAMEGGFLPLTLHLSGPLLDWMEARATDYLDLVGRLASEGKLELLLAGYYEPILPSLCREDRLDQIRWMKETLKSRFGVDATGCWLTERVWEPELAADLVEAGVEYVLVDDRHFVAAGFPREELHQHFRTEACGRSLGVFPIDETLRYFIPFHAPADTVSYLRKLRASGQYLAVAADDIEKFGGWPGTRAWVYDEGWLDGFMEAMVEMKQAGEIRISTFSQALAELKSGGLAYLPSASYREMEEWALPPEAIRRLDGLKERLGQEELSRGDSPLIRGSHWRNFLVKYPESNRMHKKMLALSALCRERGNPESARRALGQAQCNDVYWHGVFGGLYLRHLRDHVWRKLAEAEGLLRVDDRLAWERLDLDMDGHEEIWLHSAAFSALVSPVRGGALEELTLFRSGVNLANTLTRRREPYHEVREPRSGDQEAGTPSIHDLEEALSLSELPPADTQERALFVERVLPGEATVEDLHSGSFGEIHSWAGKPFEVVNAELRQETGEEGGDPAPSSAEVMLTSSGPEKLEKTFQFQPDGALEVSFQWNPDSFPPGARFSTELSLGADAEVLAEPQGEIWRFPISTFSKSEKGLDETVQGESVTILWPKDQGWGRVRLIRE